MLPQQLLESPIIVFERYLKYWGVLGNSWGNSAHLILATNKYLLPQKTGLGGTTWQSHWGNVCECFPAQRAPLSIPCSLHFPCKALVFSHASWMSSFCAVIGDRSVRLTKSCWASLVPLLWPTLYFPAIYLFSLSSSLRPGLLSLV